jgi:ABC-2 type transport system permease protein
MAGVSPLPSEVSDRPRGPSNYALFSAVTELRWRLLVNSLRTVRGRLELVSRILAGFSVTMLALGGTAFLIPVSYFSIVEHHPVYLAIALWVIFAFWQLYPVMGSLTSVSFEFATLLRFPMSFSTYWWLAFVYGLVDPVCIMSLLWLCGMLAGIGAASPSLLPGAALALLCFALVNIFLSRAVYLWLERWLAKRRSREIMGLIFLFAIVSFQFLGPLGARLELHPHRSARSLTSLSTVLEFFPPGLAGFSLQQLEGGDTLEAVAACAGLVGYSALLALLLNSRLRAQFLGENLSEAAAPVAIQTPGKLREGWDLRGLSGPVAAIFEKETRYLLRSAPVLFMFVMPIVILVLFRVSPGRSGAGSGLLMNASEWAFPVGAAYALLMLTNIVYNTFGADGSGLQFFLISPVPMREVLLAKNLAHTAVHAINTTLVLIASSFLYRPPRLDIAFTTGTALLFAFPLNLAAGNLMSVYSPKRYDLAAFGRQRASAATALIGMFVQIFVIGVSVLVIFLAYRTGRVWLAGVAFLPLAAAAFLVYWVTLKKSAQAAMDRREVLVAEICRVASDATTSNRVS